VQPAPLPAPVQAFAPDFARRFGLILATLTALIARRFLRQPRFAALIVPLWTRLNRAARRFERLMVRLTAGRLPPLRRPHPGGPCGAHTLPTGRFWLIRALGPEAAACATQLQALLAEPAAAGLLAAVPAARRIVLPLGRLLGLSASAPARRPRAPRPARPRPPPLPPIRPTSPYPSAKWPWLDRSFRKRD
jgi:hypothetical protein